jgi:hypothetical protein
MPVGPSLVETAGSVVGIIGVSWLTFGLVSYNEVLKKQDEFQRLKELQQRQQPPPPSKSSKTRR